MAENKEHFQESRQGSGSAENQGGSREEQQNQTRHLDPSQRKDVARSGDIGMHDLADLSDLGALSGRDDNAGGPGNDIMGDQSTGQETDR